MDDDDRFLVDTSSGAELGTAKHTRAHTSFNKKHKPSSQVFSRLTVVIGPQEHDAGVVIGGACTGGWSYC